MASAATWPTCANPRSASTPTPPAWRRPSPGGWTRERPDAFFASPEARDGGFDSLLVAHVLEHLPEGGAEGLIAPYLRFLRPGGQLILITPQEAGYASDATHLTFLDLKALRAIATGLGLEPERSFSFPFPRLTGRLFRYNEFVLTALKGV